MGASDPKIIKASWKEYSEGIFDPYKELFTGIIFWDDENETIWYMREGKVHRQDGPAVENKSGFQCYYFENQLHRRDGPAIIYPDGSKIWALDGRRVTPQEVFEQLTEKEKEEVIWNLDQWS